jgi:anaerobic ribonucleoside-triphosphate reductase activating protein
LRDLLLNLHAVERRSLANGPGNRFVIWFQGCTLRCPGCYNPETHPTGPRSVTTVDSLLRRIDEDSAGLDGVTITGGEPFEQPYALLAFLRGLRELMDTSVLLFSGHTLVEIDRRPLGREILGCVDILIAGRFAERQRLGRGLRGSANKRIHLLTDRHGLEEVESTPTAELLIDAAGRIAITGIDPFDRRGTGR